MFQWCWSPKLLGICVSDVFIYSDHKKIVIKLEGRKYQAWQKKQWTTTIARPVSIMCLESREAVDSPFQRSQYCFLCNIFILPQLYSRKVQLKRVGSCVLDKGTDVINSI